jgi:SWI/SNF-related matrix-associated actin-dependent regulator 1 of chromatin subfamily A
VGIDHLNARLSSAEEVPALPALPALPVLAATPQQERAASPTAHAAALEALLRPASPRAATLVEIATEVALLNALSEVLVRHHEAAQSRAAAASARLQRAEAHAADIASVHALVRESPGESGSLVGIAHDVLGSAAVQSYRDARAEARSAAARDAAVVARSRELLALSAGEGSARTRDVSSLEDHPLAAPPLLAASPPPRDHTPAAGGALVVRSERAASSVAAVRASTSGALRGLLDYAFSDADFASVLALLAAVGGNAGPAPASPQAIRALTELRLEGAAAQEACCPVCLADLGTACVKAMPCGSAHKPHAFHAHCIERWLAIRNSCPVCRCALAEPAVEEDAAAAEQSLQEQALLAVTHEQGPLTRLRFN